MCILTPNVEARFTSLTAPRCKRCGVVPCFVTWVGWGVVRGAGRVLDHLLWPCRSFSTSDFGSCDQPRECHVTWWRGHVIRSGQSEEMAICRKMRVVRCDLCKNSFASSAELHCAVRLYKIWNDCMMVYIEALAYFTAGKVKRRLHNWVVMSLLNRQGSVRKYAGSRGNATHELWFFDGMQKI